MIISIINNKGGVGKTTITKSLGEFLSNKNYKTLIIDLDSQGHQALAFNLKPTYYITDVVNDNAILIDAISSVNNNLDILCSNDELLTLEQDSKKVIWLKELIDENSLNTKYDYILIDCPPSLGKSSQNAMLVSNKVLVPVIPSLFSLDGIIKINNQINLFVDENVNPNLSLDGYIINMYKKRSKNQNNNIQLLTEAVGEDKVYKTFIRDSVSIQNTQDSYSSIFNIKNIIGKDDITSFCNEFLKRNERGN